MIEYRIGSRLIPEESSHKELSDEQVGLNREALANLIKVALKKFEDERNYFTPSFSGSTLFLRDKGLLVDIRSDKTLGSTEEVKNLQIVFYLVPGADLDFIGNIFEIELPGKPDSISKTFIKKVSKYTEAQFNTASEIISLCVGLDYDIFVAALAHTKNIQERVESNRRVLKRAPIGSFH